MEWLAQTSAAVSGMAEGGMAKLCVAKSGVANLASTSCCPLRSWLGCGTDPARKPRKEEPLLPIYDKAKNPPAICDTGQSSSRSTSTSASSSAESELSSTPSSRVRPRAAIACIRPLPVLFMGLLATHKLLLDVLTRATRVSGQPYCATAAVFWAEMIKVPVLGMAVLASEGRSGFMRVMRQAAEDSDGRRELVLPALGYSAQGIFYFKALTHISVATYQILSQVKLLFTALFMWRLMERNLSTRQTLALILLLVGTIVTQWPEEDRSASVGDSMLVGGVCRGTFYTLVGALFGAYPNVKYEQVLKKGGDMANWANNIQIRLWILFWLLVFRIASTVQDSSEQVTLFSGMLTGITGWVWLVIGLQSLQCLLVPAILKHGDNIIYSSVKPLSIVIAGTFSCRAAGMLPRTYVGGGALVITSIYLYGL